MPDGDNNSVIMFRYLRVNVLGPVDFAAGRYQLLLAAQPASYALTIDLRAMVPWTEWPVMPDSSPVRVALEYAGQSVVLQTGRPAGGGWTFAFHKHLAADSQPFDVAVTQTVGWTALPWGRMAVWALFVATIIAFVRLGLRQRAARSRAEELLRLGQVARLNTLGELAAGMAHELNQPLTTVLANTQAARRLLDDAPPSWTPPAGPWRKRWSRRAAPPRWWGACAVWWSGPT
jgi:signal transduction histidine kinase